MTSKEFKKQIKNNLKELGLTMHQKRSKGIDLDTYLIDTIFGEFQIMVDPSPRIKLYTVFCRFTDINKFDRDLFIKTHSKYDTPSKNSLKWNLHNSNPDYVINEITERVDNLIYLNKKENLELVLQD